MDFGPRPDAEPLYRWLDQHHPMECGGGAGTFLSDQFRRSLEASRLSLADGGGRLYLMGPSDDGSWLLGRFVRGGRPRAPWRGWADESEPTNDYAD